MQQIQVSFYSFVLNRHLFALQAKFKKSWSALTVEEVAHEVLADMLEVPHLWYWPKAAILGDFERRVRLRFKNTKEGGLFPDSAG